MKRIFISGLTWQLANQPCLILATASSDYFVSFPCDPIEVSSLFKIARREVQPPKLPLLASATAKLLAQTYTAITSVELLERKELADRATINVLTGDGTIKALEMTCMEAVALALVFSCLIPSDDALCPKT